MINIKAVMLKLVNKQTEKMIMNVVKKSDDNGYGKAIFNSDSNFFAPKNL